MAVLLAFLLQSAAFWRVGTWWQKEKASRIAAEGRLTTAHAALATQSAAVAAWEQKGAELAQDLKAAQGRADRVRVVTQTRIQEVLVQPVPSKAEEAVAWGAGEAAAAAARWQPKEGPR
jgi:hypothetical protein